MKTKFFALTAIGVFLAGHAPAAFSCFLTLSPTPDWRDTVSDDDIEKHYFHGRFIYRIEAKKEQNSAQIYVWMTKTKEPHVFVAHADNVISLNEFLSCMKGDNH